jgi:hypothetical protein
MLVVVMNEANVHALITLAILGTCVSVHDPVSLLPLVPAG